MLKKNLSKFSIIYQESLKISLQSRFFLFLFFVPRKLNKKEYFDFIARNSKNHRIAIKKRILNTETLLYQMI